MAKTLVIMAAGLGSRFGGIKQLVPVGPGGEIIMEYSIFDAIEAGFDKVVFVIRTDIEEDFKAIIGNKISKYIDTEYVYQDIHAKLYSKYTKEDRTRPWGTGQAILACADKLDNEFVVINADDYYGKEAYCKLYNFKAEKTADSVFHFSMAGFLLRNTLSTFGGVTRGICKVDGENYLTDIVETRNILSDNQEVFILNAGKEKEQLNLDSLASMNMWGFTQDFFGELENRFITFLKDDSLEPMTKEYLLPDIVAGLLRDKKALVKVLDSADKWIGVTYQEDSPIVESYFKELLEKGIYPAKLFK